jgi:cytochrome c oxidase subunit 1
MGGLVIISNYNHWRHRNRGKRSPLLAYLSLATIVMWFIGSLGIMASLIFQLIPWSFGNIDTVNVLLTRMLFWFFGHPLVYFWLLPAYMIWYVNFPKIIGSHVFSDALTRVTFLLLIIFSLPVGFHHELTDPGIHSNWKFLHVVLTMAVTLPSLITAFSVLGTMEQAGRKKGGTGLLGWFWKLPWRDARFVALFIGMLSFIPAGASGIINSSNQVNQVVHNSLFVTGHFHLTLSTSVTLTFLGASYWLIPTLTNRIFTPAINRLAMIQAILWGIGVWIMSIAMYILGILGEPRRIAYTTYLDHPVVAEWFTYRMAMSLGGVIMTIGALLFFVVIFQLLFTAPKGTTEYPIGETVEGPSSTPAILDRWGLWITIMIILQFVGYAYPILDKLIHAAPGMPPIKSW